MEMRGAQAIWKDIFSLSKRESTPTSVLQNSYRLRCASVAVRLRASDAHVRTNEFIYKRAQIN